MLSENKYSQHAPGKLLQVLTCPMITDSCTVSTFSTLPP